MTAGSTRRTGAAPMGPLWPVMQEVLVVLVLLGLLGNAGCERVTRDMAQQPRYNPGTTSPLFADTQASRPAPAESVAYSRGDAASFSSGRRGRMPQMGRQTDAQPAITMATLARGRERYDIYCAACHGLTGGGDGEVVRRGFPAPTPFTTSSAADLRQVVIAIDQGNGAMNGFSDRIPAADAWAIAGYLQALALSQSIALNRLPASLQQQLTALPATSGATR